MKTKNRFFFVAIFLGILFSTKAQTRFDTLRTKLISLSKSSPGLKEPVDFSVSGVSIQEFLRGIAESNSLNVSIDPSISVKIVNNFNNETALEIFVFLCKEHDLDIVFTGTIMSFKKYIPPSPTIEKVKPKDIIINYNSYGDLLTMDLQNDTLEKVVKKITQLSKKNVIIPVSSNKKLVSGYIQEMPFENALDKLGLSNSMRLNKTKDNFYVLEPVDAETPSQSIKNKGISLNRDTQLNTDGMNIEVLSDTLGNKLLNLDAINSPISDIIKVASKELNKNYFLFSEPKGNTTIRITKASFDDILSFLLQGTEHTFKKSEDIYLIGDRNLEGLRTTKVCQLQNRSAETIIENIPADLKKGVDIKHFKELNSLILSGSTPRIIEIESFVKTVDRIVPMIQIEVLIVNVSRNRNTRTGIQAGVDSARARNRGGTLFPGLDFTFSSSAVNNLIDNLGLNNNVFNLGRVTPNFYVSLRALEETGNIKVNQTPKLSTLNSHEATLKIGQTRYYELQTQNVQGSLTPNVTRTVQYNQVQANLMIKINPTVSGDDQVTLDIDVENSDFLEIPPVGPPPTSTSSFKSIIRVKNGEMIVLGGLEREEKRESGSGVPVLSRIPILKWIFSSKTKSKSKQKQLVFIKPIIIY